MNSEKNRKSICIFLLIVMAILVIMLGPFDTFTHGYYADEISLAEIDEDDLGDRISLESDYEIEFVPLKKHFVGFSIYLINLPSDSKGKLKLTVFDKNNSELDKVTVDLSDVNEGCWHKVRFSTKLKKNTPYRLRFNASGCKTWPMLQMVDSSYLPDETRTGDILVAYAYSESTFSIPERCLIIILIIGLSILTMNYYVDKRKRIREAVIFIVLIVLLTWNYTQNGMNTGNNSFTNFESNSQSLITGMIYADKDKDYNWDDNVGLGIGVYYGLKGELYLKSTDWSFVTNEIAYNGYHRSEAAIVLDSNIFTQRVADQVKYIIFKNNQKLEVVENNRYDNLIILKVDSKKNILNPRKYGSLDEAIFIDSDGRTLPRSLIKTYKSQFGLHAKIFKVVSRLFEDNKAEEILELMVAFLASITFVGISFLIYKNYNFLMAFCFFIVFWLSPWIVNFARNLYWIEFSWFVPMFIGLLCVWKRNNRKYRIGCYVSAFFSILFKALCGYEYMSTIMISLVAFLIVETITLYINNERLKARALLQTTIIIAFCALAGFAVAMTIHSYFRGEGNIVSGIKDIINQDILRRTNGADLNRFDPIYYDSFNASIWETLKLYFSFSTEIVAGITGTLFPILCIVPIFIFIYDIRYKEIHFNEILLYNIFLIAPLSWFCLAKGHSYYHTHLNFVLWYFGFIQICFYIILSRLLRKFNIKNA